MEDPERILTEIKFLIETHHYKGAQIKLNESLDLILDKDYRRQLILQKVFLSLFQGEEISSGLLIELDDFLESNLENKARAEILHAIADVEFHSGHFNETRIREYLQEALILYQKLSNPKAIISVLNILAGLHCKNGQWNALLKVLTEIFALEEKFSDPAGYGRALLYFAIYERWQGSHDLAISHFEWASEFLEEAGDVYYLNICLNNLADLEITRGRLVIGQHLLRRVLFGWRLIGHRQKEALILTQMGRAKVLKGDILEAKTFIDYANALMRPGQSQNQVDLVYELYIQAELKINQGNLERALQLAKKALGITEELNFAGLDLAYARLLVTKIFLEMKKIDQAEEALEKSKEACALIDYSEGIVNNIRFKGILELEKVNLGLAQEYLEVARKKAEEKNFIDLQIQTELSLADLYLRKLRINVDKESRKNAKRCLLRASYLVEQTPLEPKRLEARILQAIAHSIDLAFEKALRILAKVEKRAKSLKLNLLVEKTRKVRAQMLIASPKRELSEDELLGYIKKAQKYIMEARPHLRPIEKDSRSLI
ncbi:MAG: hypothetical protein ACFFB3_05730 [Candidatus Hodarchaeota archaeon]